MLTRDQAETIAAVTGQKLLPPVRILDLALAKAGMSRAERRRLIKVLIATATDPE
ncbi:MAG: hypothetical protein Q8L13_19205 [Bradyrhizobium sp.]|uniref:hypothetical protein n=1 Tax=Bradyrhizobium sp. TaxID=376 RepID=UPI002730C9BF|nr:hypothetical protein [Bradyrhizobium sp.]MDP1868451.1 hypothetical protein [Bradyrhizobium sp.]